MNRYFQISSRTIKIVLLTLQSFTSGLFLAYYFTFANGVFLEKNKPEDLPLLLPLVYILSGLTGLGLAKFYSHLLTKVNTRSLFQGTLLFLLFTTSLMYFFYSTYSYLIIIMAFIALSSFYTLVGFQFWGIAFKMFDIRESKKIFGLLGNGDVVASIFGFLTVNVLYDENRPQSLLGYAVVSLIISILIQTLILGKYYSSDHAKVTEPISDTNRSMARDKYIQVLFLVTFLSVLAQYFIDYNFLEKTKHFLASGGQLLLIPGKNPTEFIANFFVVAKIMELILRVFSGSFIKEWGIKIGLVVLPFSLFVIYNIYIIMEFIDATSGKYIVLIFSLIVIGKLFDRAVRRGIDEPSYKVLLQPLDVQSKLKAQAIIDGYGKQAAITFSGICLLIIHFIGGFNPINMLLLIIIGSWLYFSRKSFSSYSRKLSEILNNQRKPSQKSNSGVQAFDNNEQLVAMIEPYSEKQISPHNKSLIIDHIMGKAGVVGEIQRIVNSWYKYESDLKTKMFILKLANHLGLNDILLSNLSVFSQQCITRLILNLLVVSNFNYLPNDHKEYFRKVLDRILEDIVWLQNVRKEFDLADKNFRKLLPHIDREIEDKNELLFLILSILKKEYDMQDIRQHLSDNRSETNKMLAITLIENIFKDDDPQIKNTLIAILERDFKALRNLSYITYVLPASERLKELVYKDLFTISEETKYLAFNLLCEQFSQIHQDTIQAFIYHPIPKLRIIARKFWVESSKQEAIIDSKN